MKSHSKRKRVFRPPTSDFPFPTSTLASDFRRHAFAAESCILMRQLDIAVRHHEFISLSVFSFVFFFHNHVCPLKDLKFMLVTELQHCQNNNYIVGKH